MFTASIPTYELGSFSKGSYVEIKGTYFYPDTLNTLFRNSGAKDNEEFFVDVTLVPEPDNPHSTRGHAISVRWNDLVIGHIASDMTEKFQQVRRVAASGYDARVSARIWTNTNYKNERDFWVSVKLPEPDFLVPLNDPPHDGFTFLPYGTAIQVTKESDHMDVLSEFVPPSGQGQILVSLHIINAGVRKEWDGIEVRLDNQRIGELTKASSEKFAPVVRHFDDLGLSTLCRALIKGSSLAAEVTLYGARAHELSEEDLEPKSSSPLPRLVEYQSNPFNYQVPNRWPGEQNQRAPKSQKSSSSPFAAYRGPSQPSKSLTPFVAQTPAPQPSDRFIDWDSLLQPDGTPRATPFQRGVTRGLIGKHFSNQKSPRIDFATVGQCDAILRAFGEPTDKLYKDGRTSWPLWWALMAIVTLLVMLLNFIPGIGPIFPLIGLIVLGHHFWTRRKLNPPFGRSK